MKICYPNRNKFKNPIQFPNIRFGKIRGSYMESISIKHKENEVKKCFASTPRVGENSVKAGDEPSGSKALFHSGMWKAIVGAKPSENLAIDFLYFPL